MEVFGQFRRTEASREENHRLRTDLSHPPESDRRRAGHRSMRLLRVREMKFAGGPAGRRCSLLSLIRLSMQFGAV
ncbi:hypothetical protein RRG08_016094 [Elysia crispata]|uniref:Uncharacterized protein n=1 Tax=Elysia crispata TaxID=231223 RepID=A0AAE0ZP06_9GAST|nr:hypothetical protein RRG08_016094 [Elysia crispata]